MPHTNRKKKSSANSNAGRPTTTKPTIVHTKRQEVQDDDGWTHVIDTPRSKRGGNTRSATLNSNSNSALLHTAGDFEINGVSYVDRTLEEVRADFEFWKKGWEESEACRALRGFLVGKGEVGEKTTLESEGKIEVEGEVLPEKSILQTEEVEERSELEGKAVPEKSETDANVEAPKGDDIVAEKGEDIATETEQPAAVEVVVPVTKPSEKVKVDNIIVLGLGSLQSARREGRRASATQLAALQTIIKTLGGEQDIKVVLQEPQFTTLDKELLASFGYEVVEDPQAFSMITETSLVYAIHCYAQVYRSVSEAKRPAMLIGTDIENFWKFNLSETAESMQQSLEEVVKGCEVSEFPQLRHDFSDTKIYWRTAPSVAP